ncbi:hypothetical protein DO97_19555 [Neosynechococcus sphagnicola sy1]|uniref:Uncharacterized protein n=1 Tax=Neosynechococcus sphagnicola sy1 TaxID=1497020 RepID=A0A098TFW7_9CYAN|nr:hypothetical protein [Neosynechococcus sphagnicola]KGF71445.1 hypothetical protein DO97_19555 [Neosynechococcus sphagnicola sy1]
MAEHAFYLVPSDPFYLPDDERNAEFFAFFKEVSPLPNANGGYDFEKYDDPVLVDSGDAFEAVICPGCCARLEMLGDGEWGEHYDWWQSVMEQPRNSTVKAPCCGTETRVVDFKFDSPGAFARFAVGALEPSDSDYWEDEDRPYGLLKPETLARFEEILGCGVVQIWQVRT